MNNNFLFLSPLATSMVISTIGIIFVIAMLMKWSFNNQLQEYRQFLKTWKQTHHKPTDSEDLKKFGDKFRELIDLLFTHKDYHLVCIIADYLKEIRRILNTCYEQAACTDMQSLEHVLSCIRYNNVTRKRILMAVTKRSDQILLETLYEGVVLNLDRGMLTHFPKEIGQITESDRSILEKVDIFLKAYNSFLQVSLHLSNNQDLYLAGVHAVNKFDLFLKYSIDNRDLSEKELRMISDRIGKYKIWTEKDVWKILQSKIRKFAETRKLS